MKRKISLRNNWKRAVMTEMIVTENLSKKFGENTAVEQLSISIPSGEVFGLLGPNGAGKTTTIRMLSALIARLSARGVRPRVANLGHKKRIQKR